MGNSLVLIKIANSQTLYYLNVKISIIDYKNNQNLKTYPPNRLIRQLIRHLKVFWSLTFLQIGSFIAIPLNHSVISLR